MSPEDREAYAAPPAYRPMSAGAITALVLSIVLLLPALFGIWWVEIAPILIAALCWGGISGGRRRGAGLAIAASIVALLGGLAALAGHRMLADKVETALTPFAEALVVDDRATLSKWATEGDLDTRADLWKRRMSAAKEEAGAFRHRVAVGSTWTGTFFGMIFAPGDVEEIEPKGEKWPGPGEALWIRAPFEREDIWLAIEGRKDPKSKAASMTLVQELDPDSDGHLPAPHWVVDVRLFRPRKASGPK